jgi:hypothetical protein
MTGMDTDIALMAWIVDTAESMDELVSLRDRLPNLQLPPGLENIGKSDKAPDDWLAAEFPSPDDRSAFLARHALPSSLPHSVDEFAAFFEQRRSNLTARVLHMFKIRSPDPVGAHTGPPPGDLDEELAEGDYED